MNVAVLTSSTKIDREIDFISMLFDSGLETLHLRKPKWAKEEIEDFIRSIPDYYHNRIVVHGHYDLAVKYKLKGIHLHRRHRTPKFKNRLKRILLKIRHPKLQVSCTFNSLESLRENKQSFDYIFLNSVFTSHSHFSRSEEAGINMLKAIVGQSPAPVYAMGGIDREKIAVSQAAGFAGVGLSSAVWKSMLDDRTSDAISLIQEAA